jgi:ribosomal protein L18E
MQPIRVAAFGFSGTAREKITAAGGTCLSIGELAADQKNGAKCRILG